MNKDFFKSKIKLNIKGKNIERFIKRLKFNNIELLKIDYIKYNEINIIIYKKDLEKINEIKTTYEIQEEAIYGIIKMKKELKKYQYILISLFICIMILLFLSKIIFKVEIVYNDSNIRLLLLQELSSYGISKYSFKKNYEEIQIIKKEILEKYKDSLEWIEIEEKGTFYIVRLEERIIPDLEQNKTSQHVIAKKGAILKNITASSGQIVKELNTYVNKGDIVISGDIKLNEEIKNTIKADGKIYGEVWYEVKIEYPYIYSEIKETGNTKENYIFRFINKEIELKKGYDEKKVLEKVILNHSFLPISLVLQNQKEIVTLSSIKTVEEAKEEAIKKANEKLLEQLESDERIIHYQILKSKIEEDKVVVNLFFTVYENITAYQVIENGDTNVP